MSDLQRRDQKSCSALIGYASPLLHMTPCDVVDVKVELMADHQVSLSSSCEYWPKVGSRGLCFSTNVKCLIIRQKNWAPDKTELSLGIRPMIALF